MSRDEIHALIIWSTFARDTVREIAQHAGMTETEVVEAALRQYVPPYRMPYSDPEPLDTLVRRGLLLVKPAAESDPRISAEEAAEALAATRGGRP